MDESGFPLLPGVVKTYAPAGRTPVLREELTRDHLSVMGGMTPQGKIYTPVRQESLNGMPSIEFLIHLGRVAATRLLVIWDGSPIHRRGEVQEFVSETRGKVRLDSLAPATRDESSPDAAGAVIEAERDLDIPGGSEVARTLVRLGTRPPAEIELLVQERKQADSTLEGVPTTVAGLSAKARESVVNHIRRLLPSLIFDSGSRNGTGDPMKKE